MSDRTDLDDDLPEMELTGGVRGKYYERYKAGTNVVLLEPDVARVFRDSAVVNETLRQHLAEQWPPTESDRRDVDKRNERVHRWRLDANKVFWDALASLEDSSALASVLVSCLERLLEAPQSSAQIADTPVRVVSTAEKTTEGHPVPPLRIVYAVDEQNDTIELLFVQLAENAIEVPPKIASQIEDFLRRAG